MFGLDKTTVCGDAQSKFVNLSLQRLIRTETRPLWCFFSIDTGSVLGQHNYATIMTISGVCVCVCVYRSACLYLPFAKVHSVLILFGSSPNLGLVGSSSSNKKQMRSNGFFLFVRRVHITIPCQQVTQVQSMRQFRYSNIIIRCLVLALSPLLFNGKYLRINIKLQAHK